MNTKSYLRNEHGQVLIQFALMFMAVLAFVALAVEAGNVYAERRLLQNAADASALAAARDLCLNRGEATALNSARTYLSRNGMSSVDISLSEISIENNRVTVTARRPAETLLARVLGWNEINVGATARSACGAAASACGLWPVALDYALYEGVQCGQSVVIWDADFDGTDAVCEIDGVPHDVCDCYDCDLDDDGSNDFVIVASIARGWMDFPEGAFQQDIFFDSCDSNGCGTSELTCRLLNNYGGRMTLPACLPGLRGVKAGAKDEVNARAGETVNVPLFASINCAAGNHCTGKEAETFYVTRFGCVTVTGWVQNFTLNPKPGMPKTYKKITSKAVLATKDCSGNCMTFCGTTTGQPAEPWELRAASLVP